MADSAESDELTELLARARGGDSEAFDRVYAAVYEELKQLARQIRFGGGGVTLDTTGLVHEAYLKMLPSRTLAWEGRPHFFGVVARAMRQVLAVAAERRNAEKRGGGRAPVTLSVEFPDRAPDPIDLLALDSALRTLEAMDPRQARVVECRVFTGLSVEETAVALDLSPATVKRDWRLAQAWLVRALS